MNGSSNTAPQTARRGLIERIVSRMTIAYGLEHLIRGNGQIAAR